MTAALSEREQRLLAAALLVAAIALAWFAAAAPLKAGYDARRDRRDAAEARLRHDQRLVAGGQAALGPLVLARAAAGPLTLDAKDAALAGRLAQLRVARAAAQSGVKVAALKTGAADRPLLTVEADLRGDHASLLALLQRLEADAPRARVDHWVETRSEGFQGSEGAPAALDAHLSLTYAYRPD